LSVANTGLPFDRAKSWPESSSPTDHASLKHWLKAETNETSLFFGTWTLPSLKKEPSVKVVSIEPQEIAFTTNLSPLGTPFKHEKPLSIFSTPLFPLEKSASTTGGLTLFAPERVLTLSQPLSGTILREGIVSDLALESIVLAGKGIRFEDGVENDFSRRLVHFVTSWGETAVDSLRRAILDRKVSPEIASEALTWLARVNDPATYGSRLKVLIEALLSNSPQIRDGASLGLALLNDPAAIPWAQLALQLERNSELRNDMAQVLSQLESQR